MRIAKYIFPSFEMNIKSYESNEKIEFEGSNNWNILLFVHFALLTVIGIILFISHEFLWESVLGRGTLLLTIFIVGSFSYNTIKSARNSKYIKEQIKFSKEGIYINHTKNTKSGRLIKTESLKNLKLIFDGRLFKFMLFGLDKPYFEFTVPPDSKFNPNEFLNDFSELLNLNIKDGARFGHRSIIELQKKQEMIQAIPLKPQERITSEVSQEKQERKKQNHSFKPKTFYAYRKNDDFIIEARPEEERLEVPKRMRISKKDRVVWHKRMLIYKEQFKFSEIADFEFKIDYKSERNRGRYIEGNLFLITVEKKKKKIFTVDKNIRGQQELIEFEILKEMEHLIEIVNKEIKENHT